MHVVWLTLPDFQLVRGTCIVPPPLPLGDPACPGTGYSQGYAAT